MYKRAIEADPNHAINLGSYGVLLNDVRHDYDQAEVMYKRAIEADPNGANNLGNYARYLFVHRRAGGEQFAIKALHLSTPSEQPLRAECNFYLFAHSEQQRVEAGTALKALLSDGVSTGDWSFAGIIARVSQDDPDRVPLLTAVSEALAVGDAAGLDQFPEWRDLP